jgi:DNA-3-methyladenine glycosylase
MSAQGIIEQPVGRIARNTVPQDTVTLARWLLGLVLTGSVRGEQVSGRIVETEAYLEREPACHGFRAMTPRNRSLFLGHGHAYVYLCYGTSYMLNVSSEAAGTGSGVLLRALEPLTGIAQMRRGREHVRPADVTRGPGRLAAAFHIDRRDDGRDLFTDSRLWIGSDSYQVADIGVSVRIGITKAVEERLRFFVAGSCYLSGPRTLNAVTMGAPGCGRPAAGA